MSAPPEGDSTFIACPAPECGRPIWALTDADGFRLCTTDAPDLSAARYTRDRKRVLDYGQELLAQASGPEAALDGLVHALNASQLEDHEVAGYVRALIQSAGGVYNPGPGLIRSGELARQREASASPENTCPNRVASSVGDAPSRSASSSPTVSPTGTSAPRRGAE